MSVDVEGVKQLVVVMSQQVQTSGPRLNDADNLMTQHNETVNTSEGQMQYSSLVLGFSLQGCVVH